MGEKQNKIKIYISFTSTHSSMLSMYRFSKRFRKLPFICSILYYWNHEFVMVTMSFDSFYHFHMSYLQKSKKLSKIPKDKDIIPILDWCKKLIYQYTIINISWYNI